MTQRAISALSTERGGGQALQYLSGVAGQIGAGASAPSTGEASAPPAPPETAFPEMPGEAVPASGEAPADPYGQFPIVTNPDKATWDKRGDGSEKGMGWLGLRQRPDGTVSSEISIGVNLGGKETEIPTMVPGLSSDEVSYLLTHKPAAIFRGPYDKMPPIEKSIMDKATDFAKQRAAKGLSPFRQAGEASPVGAVNQAENGGIDPNVPYGRQVIQKLFPEAHINEDVRDPNSTLGRENPDSDHVKTQNAVDVRPIKGMTFKEFIDKIHADGHEIVEAIDEVNHPSKYATGPHWHVVLR